MKARQAALALAASLLLPGLASAATPETDPYALDETLSSGDVVITDARDVSCTIVLGPQFDGRFYVRNSKQVLVAELYKPAGRTVELGLEPGSYDVHYEREPQLLDTTVSLADGERRTLTPDDFHPVKGAAAQRTGGEAPAEAPTTGLFMDGRTRVEFFFGFTDSFVAVDSAYERMEVGGGQGGMAFAHWIREDVALDFQFLGTDIDVVTIDHGPYHSSETHGSVGFLFGARYYFPKASFGGSFRPFVAGALGPFSEYYVSDTDFHDEVRHTHTRFGGQLTGGVDLQISRLFSLGVKLGVTFRDGYDPSFGTTFGFGFAWGKGRPPRP
jgi:hypothetical protein